ncbi:saccharopine dehydrogenase family protein [Candidatus Hodarchaeum mangrovi]
MSNYAVLGLGMMGSAICYDLLHDDNSHVYAFDADENRLSQASSLFSRSNRFYSFPLQLNVTDPLNNHPLIQFIQEKNISLVFGAIDYRYNYYLSQLCIAAGAHFVDLGGNPAIVKKQRTLDQSAKDHEITIIPDLGLAPGMINIIAAYAMTKFDLLSDCHLRVGGLPQNPKTSLNYQQVFSIRGLTNEYLEDAVIIRDRKIKTIPSLTEIEILTFPDPWGKLEAFQTAGGSSSLPELYARKIDHLTYKTIRYPGHCQYFQFLKEFGLLSSEPLTFNPIFTPREVIEYFLEQNLPRNEPDVVLARIAVSGSFQGNKKVHIYELIDYMDKKTGYSAMARTTSFPTSIIGQFIVKGVISPFGVLYAEQSVPYELFLDELAKRNIKFIFREESI